MINKTIDKLKQPQLLQQKHILKYLVIGARYQTMLADDKNQQTDHLLHRQQLLLHCLALSALESMLYIDSHFQSRNAIWIVLADL